MSLRSDEGRNHKLLVPDKDDQLEGDEGSKKGCPKTWKFAVAVLFVAALFLVGVVVGFYISQAYEPYRSAHCKSSGSGVGTDGSSQSDLQSTDDDPIRLSELHESVVDFVPTENSVLENLAAYIDDQLHSGNDLDSELVHLLQEHFNACRFDDLSVEHYDVLISLPDPESPSRLLAVDKSTNQTIVETDFKSLTNPGSLPGFVAYSPNTSAEGELIYLNRGIFDDYEAGKDLEGKIGLVRTGQSTLEEKVHLAECHGLSGLLIVEDSPALHHPHSKQLPCSDVTPYAVFHIPPGGGDPLTPFFPAIDGIWRLPLTEAKLPKIPVQTISCQTAKTLLNRIRLDGQESPAVVVQLGVNNRLLYEQVQNVISTLYGDRDSDFSVLVGASRNSFKTGSSGGIPGTEELVKVSTAISQLFHREHDPLLIPRRTIRFISWGGSDFGHLGFTEFLEKYSRIWRNKVIAYIDLDNLVKERTSSGSDAGEQLVVTSSASAEVLTDMIIEQLRSKDSSIPESLWQNVRKSSANNRCLTDDCPATLLRRHLPAPYIHVQVAEAADDAESASEESLNGSTLAQIASLLTLTLADSGVFHFQVHRTAHETIADVTRLLNSFPFLPNATREAFHSQLKRLKKSTTEFEDYIRRHLEYEKSEDVRIVNSALLQLEAEMTSVQVEVAEILARHKADYTRCVAVDNPCTNSTNAEIQLMKDMSELLYHVLAATKVTDLAG